MAREFGTRLHFLGLAVIYLLATAGLFAQRPAFPTYSITDLGTLGGPSSEAAGLNLLGDVVGSSTTVDGLSHAFLYRNGQMVDLGTLPGGTTSHATAITDDGVIVGYGGINRYGPMFREFTQGFIWQDGVLSELGALYCPCSFNVRHGTSRALAISRTGRIVGDSRVHRMALTHAFLWQAGAMDDYGNALNPVVDSVAYDVNDVDGVVGTLGGRAFFTRDGMSEDLGVLAGHETSSARAVNNIGQVAGNSFTAAGVSRAFLWDRGVMRDLGMLFGDDASEARAINIAGQVVGRSGPANFATSRAALWQDGVALDLNTLVTVPGWVLTNATGINDVGQVVGVGIHNGAVRAFRLDP